MPAETASARAIHARVLAHLLARIDAASACHEPFSHLAVEEAFPAEVYAALLAHLPPAEHFSAGPHAPDVPRGARTFVNLTDGSARRLPAGGRNLWLGVAAALTDPGLKRRLYAKLAPDLIQRYGVKEPEVPDLAGHPRPTLYRDVEGFALPPHPDTLKKVVTMHLYLPADLSQTHLGTTLYRREPDPRPEGDGRAGFTPAREFLFRPNSGYAFVVNDGPSRQSWHGRARLPAGAGVRHSLLNTFYSEPRRGYSRYLEDDMGKKPDGGNGGEVGAAAPKAEGAGEAPVLLSGGNPQIAKADGDAPVQAYIAAMPGWKREVGRRLDALIVRTVPGVRKAVRWNSPFYGIEGRGWFLGVHCITKYVKVAFFRGAALDPMPPVESKQKDVRYFHIFENDPLDEGLLSNWIRQASELPGENCF